MASTETTVDPLTRRVLLFRIGEQLYGCDIGIVREIFPARRITRLPGAPAYVAGLLNLRGTIVTVIDLGARLGAREGERAAGTIILLEHGAKAVGVGVDDVMDVMPLDADRFEPAGAGETRDDLVRGFAHLEGSVVIILDLPSLVSHVLL